MAFRFWRRFKIAPGIRLNLSKSGPSLSFGKRGAWFTVGPRGARATAGIPGTGMFWTKKISMGGGNQSRAGSRRRDSDDKSIPDQLTPGFFKRLMIPAGTESFIDGCRELVNGNLREALSHSRGADGHVDGAFLHGMLALKEDQPAEAILAFEMALESHQELGQLFKKFQLDLTLELPVTPEFSTYVGPDLRGVLIGLVEAYQMQGQLQKGIPILKRLNKESPEDLVVILSLAELLLESKPDATTLDDLDRLCYLEVNDHPVEVAIHLMRARVLMEKGMPTAARVVATFALRKKKNRPVELLRALRVLRAGAYEGEGKRSQARKEWQKLHAQDPNQRDVAEALNRLN